MTEPIVTETQARREKQTFRDLPGQLARLVRDSITALRATPLAAKLIVSAAVLCIPSYLTKMFVQQRLVELGWPTALLFVPMLLSGLASMLGVEAARRLHPKSLRRFYAVCALLCGGGCALVGAAPTLGCIFGCMLVQGVIDATSCMRTRSSTMSSPATSVHPPSAWTAWSTACCWPSRPST